jgi:glycosyltransferase involved in cell wall biosynthesis
MRVVHCVGWYFPERVGGSEVYVRNLCRQLVAMGVQCVVMAPAAEGSLPRSTHEGVPVLRYPPGDLERFRSLLAETGADVFHLHSAVLGAGWPELEVARRLLARTLTTVHVPGPVCLRGTLMRMGTEPCDGRIEPRRCAACWALQRGAGRSTAELLARISPGTSRLTPRSGLGRVGTALRATALVQDHAAGLTRMAAASDRLVAVSGFLHDALRANGIPDSKLYLCRQGVDRPRDAAPAAPPVRRDGPLRLCFLGRWDPLKGADVVVRAVAALPPRVQVELTLHGTGSDEPARAYRHELARLAGNDTRIRLRAELSPDQVPAFLSAHDLVVVPSVWLETGPLVAMEALVAGVPVLGSDLGGLRELIVHGRNGWLVKAGSVPAWRAAIARLARTGLPPDLDRSASGVQSMKDVAVQMRRLYLGEPA